MDGENTCTDCGIVKGAEYVGDNIYRNVDTHPNLFITHSLGTKNDVPGMEGMAAVKRYFKGGMGNERVLSCFSNACEKLTMPEYARVDAYNRFMGICRQMLQKTAEHACMAIFRVCRGDGIPIPDGAIIEAVRVSFGRKKMPSMAKMVYQHMHIIESDHMNGGEDKYYFYLVLKQRLRHSCLEEHDYNTRLKIAWYLYQDVYKAGNHSSRAREAIDHAFGFAFRIRRGRNVVTA